VNNPIEIINKAIKLLYSIDDVLSGDGYPEELDLFKITENGGLLESIEEHLNALKTELAEQKQSNAELAILITEIDYGEHGTLETIGEGDKWVKYRDKVISLLDSHNIHRVSVDDVMDKVDWKTLNDIHFDCMPEPYMSHLAGKPSSKPDFPTMFEKELRRQLKTILLEELK